MSYILSVAVPSYNVEKYLDKALTSYSDDRFRGRLDVMVINDGSTDATAQIAAKYAEKYPDVIRLINKENGGHGSAVNCGIENARGKYFRIIDGDDWVNTDNLAILLDKLENEECDMVIDQKREVNMETGETCFFPLPEDTVFEKEIPFREICNKPEISPYIMLHTLSVKTELLREHNIRILEGIFYVDIEFIIKSTMEAKTIKFVDLEVYQYLVGNLNQSVNWRNYVKRFSHHSKVTRELIRYATEKQTDDENFRKYLDERICLLINTHMNIALIFNKNRKEGKQQAKDFRKYLKNTNLKYYKKTEKRYIITSVLHTLGVDFDKLQKIKK